MVVQLLALVGALLEAPPCTNSGAFLQRQLAAESVDQLHGGPLLVTPWAGSTDAPLGAPFAVHSNQGVSCSAIDRLLLSVL